MARTVTWLLSWALLAVTMIGCSSRSPDANDPFATTGTVGIGLSLASGITIDRVNYVVTGPTDLSGTVDVSSARSAIGFVVGPLAAGSGYLITLSATTVAGDSCTSAPTPFAIGVGTTTQLGIGLTCTLADGGFVFADASSGSLEVDAGITTINGGGPTTVCPVVAGISVNPSEEVVGASSAVTVVTVPAGAAITYSVTPTDPAGLGAGEISNPTSTGAAFTCTSAGQVRLTAATSAPLAGDAGECPSQTASALITCEPAAACTAGETQCSGACTSTQNDLNNCGFCGNKCLAGEVCQSGFCGNPPTAVEGFDVMPPDGMWQGSWVTDGTSPQAGAGSAHPPALAAGTTASLQYSCDGIVHSQISFWYRGVNPAAGQNLNFYVDGVLYHTYGQSPGNGFMQVIVTVPTGTHAYRWDSTTAPAVAAQPPYWVDSIQCIDVPPAPNMTGAFGFEDGFVPPEVTGSWVIDNSSPQTGSQSIHPPLLGANATASLDFSCGGKTHSELAFVVQGVSPAPGQVLNFFVDSVLYHTYGQTPGNAYAQVILTVPEGIHTYRWDATTAATVPGQPPYWIDNIQCIDVPPAPNMTGAFGFEDGFVPPEVTGSWVIDNSSPQTGSQSIHPPLLGANATASLDFSCGGKTHSQMSFVYEGVSPAAGQTLSFFVDGTLHQPALGQTPGNAYTQIVVSVTKGTHTYEWDATTAPTVPGQPAFWIDNIQCQ